MLFKLIQGVFDALGLLFSTVVGLLPQSPFNGFYNLTLDSELLSMVAWFFPVKEMIVTCEAWLVAVSVFYLYSAILRWAKAIG